ncbi:MAG: RluA family pseudouridine synthase [Pelagibacteraceae bacterium]|nr:RluA family pseudouridine synthase [Pelagibacteraceae bacterium]MCI5078932.1 RluA family pseudouridine synthase [Pelagibacteraceae bacterium]
MNNYNFVVDENFDQKRIDQVVAKQYPKISRSKVSKIIKTELLKLNGEVLKDPSHKVKSGDQIEFENLKEETINLIPKKMDLNIIFEDQDIIIIDKPIGMVVHPGAGNYEDTMVNGLLYHCKNNLSGMNGEDRPGIVHRIDKDTSGLLVVAKNDQAHAFIAKQFEEHSIKRSYLVFVYGILRPLHGKIETLIGRNKTNRQKMSADVIRGKDAITNYETLEVFKGNKIPDISLVKCILETGRTHQIRVHMSHKGNPILGDQTYGKKIKKIRGIDQEFEEILKSLKRQALHAHTLGFIHPTTNEEVFFASELPDDLNKLKNRLETLKN